MDNIQSISRSRMIPAELARTILNIIQVRGRFRLARLLSSFCFPKGRIALRHRHGDLMVFDFGDQNEISMFFDFFAPDLSNVLKRTLRPGDCFIDCGANIGYFSFQAASLVGPHGKVLSIDANPYCVVRLEESKALGGYGQVSIIPCALGSCDGEVQFNLANDPMYSSVANLNDLDFTSTASTIRVPLKTLDEVAQEQGLNAQKGVRLLKLDVEGAEIDVLRGAAKVINSKKLDYIYVEVHRKQILLQGQNPQEVFQILEDRGFVLEKQFKDVALLYRANHLST